MFSDTHFHFKNLVSDCSINGTELIKNLVERDTYFTLDIGTKADDLSYRQSLICDSINSLDNSIKIKSKKMFFFTAGIWPDPDSIKDRHNKINILNDEIENALSSSDTFINKVCAIGECGLDHHWNPAGIDGRSMSDFDKSMLENEKELFALQLILAKKLNLPVIIHSRDAFDDTIEVLKECSYHNGVIHCFSYNKEQAKIFLDLGWHIAMGGAVTYTKKAKVSEMEDLLRYIPDDRLLLETDSPYLTPVPFRGKTNTPLLIEYVYNYIAAARNITPKTLSDIVDNNINNLFHLE